MNALFMLQLGKFIVILCLYFLLILIVCMTLPTFISSAASESERDKGNYVTFRGTNVRIMRIFHFDVNKYLKTNFVSH